ncbi:hypothetical protein T233_00826 [Vagococcus lutrae LBD1]|uniref:Nucleoid-associated protein n=1 Tax=Vagococcus lutrae LBD1 TaxID=1408226 RepID=V6Q5J9_9ENTE|nr:nucleoid-associated protein [Vagococcus lutrae]EST89930.1 hypothetical protein T233_00826 [Vagococcus lutrae LBD1]
MKVTQAILHVIDLESPQLILSEKPMDLSELTVRDYSESLLKKFFENDYQTGKLEETTTDLPFSSLSDSFIEGSHEIAQGFYDCLVKGEDVPSGDLLIFEAINDEEDHLVGAFKLNFKKVHTHYIDYIENEMVNNIILNRAVLPSSTSKVDEGIVMNLTNQTISMVGKSYKFDGKKTAYMSQILFQIEPTPSMADNIKIVKKAVKDVSTRYNEELHESFANVQQAIYESIEEEGKIDNQRIAEHVFKDNFSAKEEYLEQVTRTAFTEDIPVNVPKYEKKYRMQKFKLANGIELAIPMDVYQNKEFVEFINNPDGTISVMIKNIDEIKNKFS